MDLYLKIQYPYLVEVFIIIRFDDSNLVQVRGFHQLETSTGRYGTRNGIYQTDRTCILALMGLKAILIDDEVHARENLRILLNEYCPKIEIIGEGQDVESGLAAINSESPDVVFLDIRMPSGSEGFELLRQIGSPEFMVVFVTAFKDYAIDAFKVNAVDYILKPIDIDELILTVERLEERHASFKEKSGEAKAYQSNLEKLSMEMIRRSKRISISHTHGIKLARIEEILFLQAEGNCTRLTFKDGTQYLDTRTLKTYEEELAGHPFIRLHRSYMVNLEELEEFLRSEGNQVKLSSGHLIPVARNEVQGLIERMEKL